MNSKTVHVDGVGDVSIVKRRGQKSIKVSVNGSTVKVSQPSWLPFSAGEKFLSTRTDWIKQHVTPLEVYSEGQIIGLTRSLHFVRSNRSTIGSKQTDNQLTILLPANKYPEELDVQAYVKKKLVSVLRSEAEDYLPTRVSVLADMFGFVYKSVQVKRLKRRWGSCNSKKELVFNLNLMTLDTLHIDYVILHELTHTLHMNHGPNFWSHMESVMPGAKKIAKAVRHAPSS